jgi:hypothetical protein
VEVFDTASIRGQLLVYSTPNSMVHFLVSVVTVYVCVVLEKCMSRCLAKLVVPCLASRRCLPNSCLEMDASLRPHYCGITV